jgi:hypothetical protein
MSVMIDMFVIAAVAISPLLRTTPLLAPRQFPFTSVSHINSSDLSPDGFVHAACTRAIGLKEMATLHATFCPLRMWMTVNIHRGKDMPSSVPSSDVQVPGYLSQIVFVVLMMWIYFVCVRVQHVNREAFLFQIGVSGYLS